jgi:hypothetical protein
MALVVSCPPLKGEAMLRLVLLVLYLAASLSVSTHTKIGGGLDPNGLKAPPTTTTVDSGGGWDPDGNR